MRNMIIAVALIIGMAGSAQAGTKHKRTTASADQVVCKLDVQDGTTTATFKGLKKQPLAVTLWIPDGETSGKSFNGKCSRLEGAIELSYTCEVNTTTDSGYDVTLQSTGGSTLVAGVTYWTMSGKGKTESLPCK